MSTSIHEPPVDYMVDLCADCRHPWHGLTCERNVMDGYDVVMCGCRPQWPGDDGCRE